MNDDEIEAPKMGEEFARKAWETTPPPVRDVKDDDTEAPKPIEAPTLKLRPPGLGTEFPVMPARRAAPAEPTGLSDKVEGKTLEQLSEARPSLATRAFRRALDRER